MTYMYEYPEYIRIDIPESVTQVIWLKLNGVLFFNGI